MTHTFRYITVLLATVTTCFAGRGQEGKSSFDFLNIPTSTHAYTLGGTNISVIDEDINLVNQNPALMGPESDLQLGLNYMGESIWQEPLSERRPENGEHGRPAYNTTGMAK
mgnify:CR=1 FL=1